MSKPEQYDTMPGYTAVELAQAQTFLPDGPIMTRVPSNPDLRFFWPALGFQKLRRSHV